MKWIDREVEYPEADFIICTDGDKIFVCKLVESKWGHRYRSTDSYYDSNLNDRLDWTHWIPLPPKPEVKNGKT